MLLLLALSCSDPQTAEGQGHALRLNHRQWESTVVDLLGLTEPTGLSESFVSDPASSTFDTNLAALTVSPVLWQQYQYAAETLAERVVSEPELYDEVVPPALRPAYRIHTDAERDAWLEVFGRRAFRRSLTDEELAGLGELFDLGGLLFAGGDPFTDGVRAAVTGMLLSPGFLYRTEGIHGEPGEGGLSGEELASRLSYALWNTMPDAALLEVAAELHSPDTLRAEAERMLDDPRGHAMLADLHRQLLHVDAYAQIWRPSDEVLGIGVYAESAPAAMQAEVYAYVDDLVYSDGTVRDLLTLSSTFANSDLAEIYGLTDVEGEELVAVELDPSERAGLLTMSGFLAWQADTSTPNLIERGAFINDVLLCADIPPPPASATSLPTDDDGLTLRERIEAHTSGCGGSCHNDLINPVGFALGLYDQDGYFEPEEDGEPIDATGSYAFSDGVWDFDGAVDLAWIMAEREQVHRCYVEHLAGYLDGVASDELSGAMLDDLTAASLSDQPIRQIILDIVTDPSFREL